MHTPIFPLLLILACACTDSAQHNASRKVSPEQRVTAAEQAAEAAKAQAEKALAEKNAAAAKAAMEKMGLLTKHYWERSVEINNQFVAGKSEVWFKEFRPTAVEGTCREAARKLRELDTGGVDPVVIDHVSRAIRGFEQIAAIAKVKGQESLWRDAGDTMKFIYAISKGGRVGSYGDGGWMEMGLGLFAGGQKATAEGQDETSAVASEIMKSEESIIRHVRTKYGIELKPW